jgi:hypothetical protein
MAANPYTDPMTTPWLSPEQNQSMPGQAPVQPGQQSPLTYEQLQALLLEGSAYGEEMSDLEKQQMMADALRMEASPEGRSAGRVYVAANPLEHIGAGIKQYQGKKQSEELAKTKEEKRAAERERLRGVTGFFGE